MWLDTIAWGPECVCWFRSSGVGGLRIVLLQSFPSIEGLPMLQFKKPKRTSMEALSYPRCPSETPRKNRLSLGCPVLRSRIEICRSCWRWSFRRRESIAPYCTCSLRRSTLCLLKFSVAALLCRSVCWLGWKVWYSHTRKQLHGTCIVVCTCGLHPHIRGACNTDAAFDRPMVDPRSCNSLCSDCTLWTLSCVTRVPFQSKHTATQHLRLHCSWLHTFVFAQLCSRPVTCVTSLCFTPAQRSSPIVDVFSSDTA